MSKRNILGVLLVAGIAAGVYLGNFWKGFGGGNTIGVGLGDPSSTPKQKSAESNEKPHEKTNPPAAEPGSKTGTASSTAPQASAFVMVVSDGSGYYVRTAEGDHEADLKQIVSQAKAATGGEQGTRVKIYRTLTSRPKAEIALGDALVAAGLTVDETVWVVTPIDAIELPVDKKTPR